MDYLEYYFDKYKLNEAKAYTRRLVPTENGLRTQMKEMIGEEVIKIHKIFDIIFPENTGYKKITDKKLQKSGVDYEVYIEDKTIYIDLKSCIGPDYKMKDEDFDEILPNEMDLAKKGAPLEVYQNNEFTNHKGKLTDYFLYVFCDKTGVFFSLLSYNNVREVCLDHKNEYIRDGDVCRERKHFPYTRHISNNNTGVYIKWPVVTQQLERNITNDNI